jgi:hypothetical protein
MLTVICEITACREWKYRRPPGRAATLIPVPTESAPWKSRARHRDLWTPNSTNLTVGKVSRQRLPPSPTRTQYPTFSVARPPFASCSISRIIEEINREWSETPFLLRVYKSSTPRASGDSLGLQDVEARHRSLDGYIAAALSHAGRALHPPDFAASGTATPCALCRLPALTLPPPSTSTTGIGISCGGRS